MKSTELDWAAERNRQDLNNYKQKDSKNKSGPRELLGADVGVLLRRYRQVEEEHVQRKVSAQLTYLSWTTSTAPC